MAKRVLSYSNDRFTVRGSPRDHRSELFVVGDPPREFIRAPGGYIRKDLVKGIDYRESIIKQVRNTTKTLDFTLDKKARAVLFLEGLMLVV